MKPTRNLYIIKLVPQLEAWWKYAGNEKKDDLLNSEACGVCHGGINLKALIIWDETCFFLRYVGEERDFVKTLKNVGFTKVNVIYDVDELA